MALVKSFFFISDFLSFSYAFIIFSSFLLYSNKASEIRRPRGVSISKASFYIPDKDFKCLDNTKIIPFHQVNDDYCDCPDGSDEPGTAACPNGSFHCTNSGHRPANIPSSHVNDGICDCCDGADEYLQKIACVNICHELGKAERLEAQKKAEIAKIGNEARVQSIKKGKQLKEEKKEKLLQLEADKKEAEAIRQQKEKRKLELEELEKAAIENYNKMEDERLEKIREEEKQASEQEAFQIFTMLDSNQDKKLQGSELKGRQTFDKNKDGVVSLEEINFFLGNAEEVDWDSFVVSAWPKMKPFFMLEKGLFKPPKSNEIIRKEHDGVGTVQDVTNEYHQERREGKIEPPPPSEQEEEPHEEEEEEEEDDEEEEDIEHQPPEETKPKTEKTPQYDEETQNIVNAANEARSFFDEADRTVRDIQREITQIEEYLEKDFGPHEEFAPLEGECFEFTDREYLYKLCPFDQASQQPRSGGSETRLGVWSKWAGPDNDKYQAMLYDKGQSCWNGPQRSTFVKLNCGISNVITSVSEPNKCEYHFEFNTPSSCRVVDGLDERPHDEL